MDRCERSNGFHFDDYELVYDDVEAEPAIQFNPFIGDGQRPLASNSQAGVLKLVYEAYDVQGFEKPWPETPVNFDCGFDDESR